MYFVTGGTGLVGNCVIRELLARGHQVRALCRPNTSRHCFDGLDVEVVLGDLGDASTLERAVDGCQAVIHSAAMIHIGWKKLAESRQVNVEGTRRVVAACQKHSVPLVYISTVDTLPAARTTCKPIAEDSTGVLNPPCTYVLSKTEAEQIVRNAVAEGRLDAIIIHPGFMLAPLDWKPSSGRMMLEILKAPLALAPGGGCSVCDARDVAVGIVDSLTHGRYGQSYILAGENLTYQELWKQMLRTMGCSKRVASPKRFLNLVSAVLNSTQRLLPVREGDVNGASIAMGQLYHYYCSAKAKHELGYRNRPLEQTLTEAWHWLKHHHL